MNRRSFIGGTSASLITAAVTYAAIEQRGADEGTELASRVADLEPRVDAIETEVALLREDDDGGAPAPVADEEVTGSATIDGTGTTVSDPFRLSSGRYRVNVTVQPVSGFAAIILEVFDPSGTSELVLNEFGESTGEWSGSTIYDAPTDGEYFVSVSNTTGPWSITFEPF